MREVPFLPKPREVFSQGFVSVPTKVFQGLPEVYVSFFFGGGEGGWQGIIGTMRCCLLDI